MNFLAILWNLKSYLMSKQVLAFNKSKYYNSDHRVLRAIYVSIQIFSSISIIWCHSFEWQSTLKTKLNRFSHGNPRFSLTICMTFWTILWYLTSYLTSKCHLTPSKSKNVKHSDTKIGCPSFQSFDWDIWRFGWFLDRFGSFLGLHDVTKGIKIL